MDKPSLIRIEDTIFNPAEITQIEVAHTEVGHDSARHNLFTDGKSKAFRNQAATAALAAIASMTTEIKTE